MRKFFSIIVIATVIGCVASQAQNYALYSTYPVNLYLYNPAEAATEYTYLFFNHRQQWLGFAGAPVLTTASLTTLLNETHSGVGLKLSCFKRGLLETSDISFTYAHGIPLSQRNTIFFGMSAGAIMNNIDVTNVDATDPAITSYMVNNLQPAGNFGMLFRSASGLNIGMVLPQLFVPKFNSSESFENTSVSPLDNILITTYYRKKLDSKLASRSRRGVRAKVKTAENYAPLELYAQYKYAKAGNSQFEITGKLNFSPNFWLGASYRQSYGMSGLMGFNIKKLIIAYSYEPGSQPEPAFSQGTHEIQVGLRTGSLKKYKRPTPVLHSTLKPGTQHHVARFQHTDEDPEHIQHEQQIKKKYYVVIKAFADFNSADAYRKKLVADKFNANIFYYEKDKKYYVHVFETTKASDAHAEVRNLKTYTKLKDARLLTVEQAH